MWQLYALGSILSTSFENVIDKVAVVRDGHIDDAVATLWRNAIFLFFTTVIGYVGVFGQLQLFFDWRVFGFAAMAALSGYLYTYMLKRIEVTGVQIETYLSPLLFLGIDIFVVHVALSFSQIVGVIVLVLGGFAFAINARTLRFKREFSPLVWSIFGFWFLYDGVEFYLFKYLHDTQSVNEVSFYVSAWLLAVGFLFAYVVVVGKTHLLFSRTSRRYLPVVTVSKFFDAVSGLLWLRALSFAAVSQVTALIALEPILLFLASMFVQKEVHLNVRERLDRKNISWKLIATTLLGFGTFLVT